MSIVFPETKTMALPLFFKKTSIKVAVFSSIFSEPIIKIGVAISNSSFSGSSISSSLMPSYSSHFVIYWFSSLAFSLIA